MFYKRFGIVVLLSLFMVFPLSASMVSFLLIETGLKTGSNSGEYTNVWEDGLMSAFFDAGHIVSNSPVMRLENVTASDLEGNILPAQAQEDFSDAARGGADFFIMAILEYNSQGGRYKPQMISIRIFSTVSRGLIYEHRFPAGTGANLRDEYNKAQETARIIAAQI